MQKEPKLLKNGNVGFVKMIPNKRMAVETFSKNISLGSFAVKEMRQTCGGRIVDTTSLKLRFRSKILIVFS